MKRIIIVSLAMLIGISAGYSYAQQVQTYNEPDNNIETEVGTNFVITLEANQTTGFKWQLAEPLDNKILQLVNVEYVLGYARFLGAGGKEVWTFKALSAGKATVSLKYIRPWERNPQSMKDKAFIVTVKEPSESNKQTE